MTRVCACAALCALGATLAWAAIVGDTGRLTGGGLSAVRPVGTCWAVGLIAGLLLPRWIIRQRLSRVDASPRPTESRADTDFAAALAGLLIMVSGGLWAVLGLLSSVLESYRRLLTECFIHPPAVTGLLLWLPLCVGISLAGAAGALVLTALHGWCGLLRGRSRALTLLWAALLSGATIGSLSAGSVERTAWLRIGALLATFGAALLAVLRPTGAASEQRPVAAQKYAFKTAWLPLLIAGATAGALVATLVNTVASDGASSHLAARTTALSLTVALAAILLVRLVPVARHPEWTVLSLSLPLALLSGWAALAAPNESYVASPPVVAVVVALAVSNLAIIAQHLARIIGRAQTVLAWVGVATAVGVIMGLLFGVRDSRAIGTLVRMLPPVVLCAAALIGPLARGLRDPRELWQPWPQSGGAPKSAAGR